MAMTAVVWTMELRRCDGGRGDRGGYRCRNTDGGVALEQRWSTPSGKLYSDYGKYGGKFNLIKMVTTVCIENVCVVS